MLRSIYITERATHVQISRQRVATLGGRRFRGKGSVAMTSYRHAAISHNPTRLVTIVAERRTFVNIGDFGLLPKDIESLG
jgi:hypothetical protein